MNREANFGGFLQETAAIMSDAGRAVLIFVLVIGAVKVAGVLLGFEAGASSGMFAFRFGWMNSGSGIALVLFELVSWVVSLVAGYWLLTQYLAARGRFHGGNRFWPYLGMSILMWLGLTIGFLLLAVPGVILMVRWSAATGFVVGAEQGVTESLTESWHATRGHGWAIFFAGIVVILAIILIMVIIGGISALGGTNFGGVVGGALEGLSSAIASAFGIAVYCLVHQGSEELQEVFA